MRRLAWLLLTTCATATLLLILATVALDARSRVAADYLWHNGERHTVGVFSSGGLAQVTVRTSDNPAPLGPGRPRWELYPSRPATSLPAMLAGLPGRHHVGPLGFVYSDSPPGGGNQSRDLIVPYWALDAVTGLCALLLVRRTYVRRRQRRRAAAGLCTSCGYDLRASPDQCPECGKSPADVQAAHPASG